MKAWGRGSDDVWLVGGVGTVLGATVIATFDGGHRVVAVVRVDGGDGGAVNTVATSDADADVARVRSSGGAGTAAQLDGVGGLTLL